MKDFLKQSFEVYDKKWALLTAGNKDDFNTMTISWGGLGTIWGKKVATVYVRPNRYTYKFMENNDYFTVSFYGEEFRKDLTTLGRTSGRDGDKVSKTSLTPKFIDKSVTFQQAEITLLCKKIYGQDMDLEGVPQDAKDRYYDGEPMHKMYIGEVVDIL